MTRSPRPLDNPINWSFAIGRMWGITIRVHLLLLLALLPLIDHALKARQHTPLSTGLAYAFGSFAMLFVLVLIHEFGHCFGARYVGGEADEVLLWPLGGLAMVSPPHNPRAHLITAICGPVVHPIFCVLSAGLLIWLTERTGAVPLNPLHPFDPIAPDVYLTTAQVWVAYFFGLNYVMLLFNLVPMFPLDGGRIFQALLWPRLGFVRSMELASGIGMFGAMALGIFGVLAQAWNALGIAVFGYITCWHTRQSIRAGMFFEEGGFGAEFGPGFGGYSERERPRTIRLGYFARRRARKALERERREATALQERRRRIDDILLKVHRHGMPSLTPAERRLLSEETERQRTDNLK
ncbi:MAG TPA: site-2 protease family protein [Phycisphaerae bacterium]|jgi:Zn-dependent protease